MLKERHCSAQGVRAVPQRQNRAVIAGSVRLRKSILVEVHTFALMELASDELRMSGKVPLYSQVIKPAIINYGYIMIKK